MSLRNFLVFPQLSDSVFADRFSRIDRLFSQLTGDTPVTMAPPYNLRQLDDEHYALTVSVPGWKESELEIEAAGGSLTVSGRKEEHSENAVAPENDNGGSGWLHRGISRQDFRLSYSIPEHMKVMEARLQDGLLSVGLTLVIPESEKPRRITIDHQTAGVIEHQT
ncbi:Hsp20 family protein [Pantoea sp. At-9b]|uniref:Hsp20 family protein n=1 Tax=Pantoea sp. (strain At-9b) TaxID=592316 RepID=UPI0001B400FB|nr:Hsp20 family protein [Pantoea sp. At-9b]ADU72160.1 heat shock protein Hsp20 [Pantoea sp. At-9b]